MTKGGPESDFVADSSIGVAWVVPAQASERSLELLNWIGTGTRFFVPSLWPFEVSNALLVLVRRKRIDPDRYRLAAKAVRRLSPVIDDESPRHALGTTSDLALRYGLSIYDASYLELAIRHQLPLASLDAALVAAARSHGLSTLPASR